MAKERVSSDVDRKLRIELDAKAEELGISRAKLIEIALKSRTRTLQRPQGKQTAHRSTRPQPMQRLKEARKQRDTFKTKYEDAESNYQRL